MLLISSEDYSGLISALKNLKKAIKKHRLHFSVKEAGFVLQEILTNTGGLKPSYLGAPESTIEK